MKDFKDPQLGSKQATQSRVAHRPRISEAGLSLCPVAYLKLTDTFIESRLLDREDPALLQACEEYKATTLRYSFHGPRHLAVVKRSHVKQHLKPIGVGNPVASCSWVDVAPLGWVMEVFGGLKR